MEPWGKEENHENAEPVNDKGNKHTFNSFSEPASPNCAKYWLTFSHVVFVPSPLNLTKSGILYPGGH